MNAERPAESDLPVEERERKAALQLLPELKALVSARSPHGLNPDTIEETLRTFEKKARIDGLESELGIELSLLAGWLRGPRGGEDMAELKVEEAFTNLKRLVAEYEAG